MHATRRLHGAKIKVNSPPLVKKFPAFYGTGNFIILFTKITACSYLQLDQSNPRPTHIV